MLKILWELIPFPKLLCLCVCFALSSDSFLCLSVLISLVYWDFLTPERQKQWFQMQLTLPLCVCFLIKFPVMLPPFPPASLRRQLIKSRSIFTWGCPKAVGGCLAYVDEKPFRGAKAKHGVKGWSHLRRHGASAAGTALKGGVGLMDCSRRTSSGYPGHGFALVMLCSWVLTSVLASTCSFSLMMRREAFKLKSFTLRKFEYESCQSHLAVGERDFPSHPDLSFTITALSHMLLNSHSNRKGGIQKGSGRGGQPRWTSSLFQPSLECFPLSWGCSE